MDQQLKQLMKELGEAINESLADSDSIAEVVSRIKEGGYDIFLARPPLAQPRLPPILLSKSTIRSQVLKSLRIKVDEDVA